MDPTPTRLLQEALRGNKVVVVVGAGVSQAVAHLPSWGRLLQSAIEHLAAVGIAPEQDIERLKTAASQAASPDDLVNTAADVRRMLVGASGYSGEFASWLRRTLDVPPPSAAALSLIRDIHGLGSSLVATTNYDKLLTMVDAYLEPATWRESHKLLSALEGVAYVVHLHGVWDEPESVVFGQADYAELARDSAYKSFMQALWTARTILFVGCSPDGMLDPDFGRLLEWAASAFPHATVRHFALVRESDCTTERVVQFLTQYRVQLVSYGAEYSDLQPFLRTLARPPVLEAPRPPRAFSGRVAELAAVKQALDHSKSVVLHGMGGIGKTSLIAKVVEDVLIESPNRRVVWLEDTADSLPELCRDIGGALGIPGIASTADAIAPAALRAALDLLDDVWIVLDNLAVPEVARRLVQDVIPRSTPILVSTRRRVTGFQMAIEVEPLDGPAAQHLFATIAGVSEEEDLVHDITDLLDGHPLAITLAAGRHTVEDLPLRSLLDRLSSEKHRLDTLRDPETEDSPSTSVRASLAVSLDGLDDDLTETLARLAHFYSATSVDLLSEAMDVNYLQCEDLIGKLVSRSLVSRRPSTLVQTHRFVSDAIKERSREDASQHEGHVTRSLLGLIAGFDESDPARKRRLVLDVENIIGFSLATTPEDPDGRRAAVVVFAVTLGHPDGLLKQYATSVQSERFAMPLVNHALALAEDDGDPAKSLTLLQCLASINLSRGKVKEALDALEKALNIASNLPPDTGEAASVQCQMGNVLMSIYDYPQAEAVMRGGLAAAHESGSPGVIAQLTGQLGQVLLSMGQLDESESHYLQAKDLYEQVGMPHGVAACAFHLAEIALRRGRRDDCWALHVVGLDAELSADNLVGALGSLEKLAEMVEDERELEFLRSQAERVKALTAGTPLSGETGIADSTLGVAYAQLGHYQSAREIVEGSLKTREAADDLRGQGIDLGRLSSIAILEGDFPRADQLNLESKEAYRKAGDVRGLITCHHNGIDIAVKLKHLEGAISESCESIRLSAELGDAETVVQTFRLLLSVIPWLDKQPIPLFPKESLGFRALMLSISEAAREQRLDRLIGRVTAMMKRFGPGGIASGTGNVA